MRNLGEAAAQSFQDFVVGFDGLGLNEDGSLDARITGDLCLADYIAAWLTEGEGLRICCGSREMFLETIIAITEAWAGDPELLYYVAGQGRIIPRTVDSVFGEDGFDHRILEPYWFERITYDSQSKTTAPNH
ncbi:hypothetical protein [Glycomyces tritici]|uniref:Uncharacterized protein n=1 Tax=Glycomyces tritici TaxID=2665176 RepID=A0ABT7YWA4_9ACTN|nr:hypothetical protein [Glycomyces tritici]MDN3240890.1 hypothetical protein [Glycomyces tritici]MDN3242907.1 hypothetical protein [Glycomyces tritici]